MKDSMEHASCKNLFPIILMCNLHNKMYPIQIRCKMSLILPL